MSKIKAVSAPSVVKGYESDDEVVSKRFVDTIRDDSENPIGHYFLSITIVVSGNAFACVSWENRNQSCLLGPDGSCSPHRPFDLQDTGTFATALQSSGFLFIKNFRNMQQRRNVSLDFKLLLTVCDVKAPDLAALVAALLEGKVDDSFPLEKW